MKTESFEKKNIVDSSRVEFQMSQEEGAVGYCCYTNKK